MTTPYVLDEAGMQSMEARIPELAEMAVHRAYLQALTTSGRVVEAINGQLVETLVTGQHRVLRQLAPPIPVQRGLRLTRRTAR